MAIVNRDLDASLQRDVIHWTSLSLPAGVTFGSGYVQTGITLYISGPMPYPFIVQSANAMSVGASGAPQLAFSLLRPAVGGMTVIGLGVSNMVVCAAASFAGFGYSGTFATIGYSGLAATGSTLLMGQRGDVLMATTQAANTACTQLNINMVVQKVQDIITMDGV